MRTIDDRLRPSITRRLRVFSACALLLMALLVMAFTTEGTWNLTHERDDGGYSGRFFTAQAEAIVRGHLDVNPKDIQGECWLRDGLCYGYFGITPSLIRMPLLGIIHYKRIRSSLVPVFLGAAILLAYWAALRLLARSLDHAVEAGASPAAASAYFVAGALALGPGGSLIFLTRPAVFEEAAAWGVGFFLLALDRVWAWRRSRSPRTLVAAIVFAVAAANARPTEVTASFVLGLVVAALAQWTDAGRTLAVRRGRVFALAACLSLLPFLTASTVFWLKFRTPLPDLQLNEQVPEAPHWREILNRNGEVTRGLKFAPTELVAYLLPRPMTWRGAWPYVDFHHPPEDIRWLWPLGSGQAYIERFASLPSTMPLSWIVVLTVGLWLVFGARGALGVPGFSREEWLFATGVLSSAVATIVLTVTTVGIVNRYLSDFFAMSVVGLALGHRVILPLLRARPVLTACTAAAAIVLIGWSVVVTMSLTDQVVFH